MNSLIVKLLEIFICCYPKFEFLFGLSSVGQRSSKAVKFVSLLIKITFVVFYPIACLKYLSVFTKSDLRTTKYARNLTFAFNWILLISIYLNELAFQGLGELIDWFNYLVKKQSPKQNFILLLKCTTEATILGSVLIKLNFNKYSRLKNKTLERVLCHECMMFFLLLPFFVLILAANRIYIANTVVKHFLVSFKHNQLNMKHFGINYGRLHDFFVSFNKANSMNFLTILSFCVLNIIYEVCEVKKWIWHLLEFSINFRHISSVKCLAINSTPERWLHSLCAACLSRAIS